MHGSWIWPFTERFSYFLTPSPHHLHWERNGSVLNSFCEDDTHTHSHTHTKWFQLRPAQTERSCIQHQGYSGSVRDKHAHLENIAVSHTALADPTHAESKYYNESLQRRMRACVCLCSNPVAPPLSATVMKLEQSLSDLWQCHVWKHLFYINESLSHSPRFII